MKRDVAVSGMPRRAGKHGTKPRALLIHRVEEKNGHANRAVGKFWIRARMAATLKLT